MEDQGILDPLNEVHLALLHYIFIPQINLKLQHWSSAWSTHRLRTAKSSPIKLWTSGQLLHPIDPAFVDDLYGTEGFIPNSEVENVNNTNNINERPILEFDGGQIIGDFVERINDVVGPIEHVMENNHGITAYLSALEVMENL